MRSVQRTAGRDITKVFEFLNQFFFANENILKFLKCRSVQEVSWPKRGKTELDNFILKKLDKRLRAVVLHHCSEGNKCSPKIKFDILRLKVEIKHAQIWFLNTHTMKMYTSKNEKWSRQRKLNR